MMRLLFPASAAVLAIALGLMLLPSPYVAVAPTAVDAFDKGEALSVAVDWTADERPQADQSDQVWTQLQLFEDDVVHEDHFCLLLPLRLALVRPAETEPDSAHVNEVDRPPLRPA